MNISILGCPFQTSFGTYIDSLVSAIQNRPGDNEVRWIGSNCGCGAPEERERRFQKPDCTYFEMPNRGYYGPSKHAWKRWIRVKVNDAGYHFRARKYARLSRDSEIAHFQQVLFGFGSSAAFQWLKQPSKACKVVTIHEFDDYQRFFPEKNKAYHLAGALIVHCEQMKQELMEMGVPAEKIHVVLYGTDLPPIDETQAREGLVFQCGYNPMNGKGLPTVYKALAILKERLGNDTPRLTVHGHHPADPPEEAKKLAEELGISGYVTWLDRMPNADAVKMYQRSILLLLPYTRSFAGEPASMAAANGLPVVCTRHAGIPDHLGKWGVWVEDDNAEHLAEEVLKLLKDEQLRRQIAAGLRKHAEATLNWNLIAEKTLDVYRSALRQSGVRRYGADGE